MENRHDYYLGLDIGTGSVGYAVTDAGYALKKFGGEPMWGATLLDPAEDAAARRGFRTARRRLDRRQQRVRLLEELFAAEIGKCDPDFFLRRRESALFPEDAEHGVQIFCGGALADREYHEKYPTIHHLILELMESEQEHDIRLVYLACAWLAANRGTFCWTSLRRMWRTFWTSGLSMRAFSPSCMIRAMRRPGARTPPRSGCWTFFRRSAASRKRPRGFRRSCSAE